MYDKELVDEILDTAELELDNVMNVLEAAIKIAGFDDNLMSDKTKMAVLPGILNQAKEELKDNVIAVLGRI